MFAKFLRPLDHLIANPKNVGEVAIKSIKMQEKDREAIQQ